MRCGAHDITGTEIRRSDMSNRNFRLDRVVERLSAKLPCQYIIFNSLTLSCFNPPPKHVPCSVSYICAISDETEQERHSMTVIHTDSGINRQ
jgi:hypothetical protein